MKKSYFLGLLFAIMALIPAQNAFADYCTVSSNSSHAERRLQSFTLTDGVNDAEVASIQPSTGRAIYQDKTSVTLTTSPGATIHFKALDWKGSWMHAYVFVDYNNDQTFDNTTNELASYNFYSSTGASSGVNSKGESVTNNCGVTQANMPSWTLPSDLEAGTYRLRFKVDWNSIDPCGDAAIATNGGVICDMTLNVTAAIPERTISVDVVPAEGGTITGAGTASGNITLTAIPNPGYDFVNWTLEGAIVGTDLTYTDATDGSKTYTANFAALTSYPEMSYFYTNGVSQSNRYLKEVTAVAGDITTTVFSATTEAELPRVDPTSIGTPITEGALIDKTATPIVINEGTTSFDVTFKAWTATMSLGGTAKGSELQWTQQAAFIDWNNNYYFYDENENYGKSSNTIGNDGGVSQSFISEAGYTRTFTVPEGVQPGTYRMRVSYSEPDGNNETQWQNSLFQKGNCTTRNGKTYDFAIVVQAVVTPSFNVSVSVNDAEMGSAKKQVGENDEITLTATEKEGYEFVNWTVADTVVSEENPYVFTAEADVEVVANFQAITSWPATMELIEKAKALIVEDGVGYPSATAKATFKEALDAAEANTTIASLAPLQAAIDTYLTTTDIKMPEAGKTYAMVLAVSETSLYYINNSDGTLATVSYDGTSELPDAAKFTAVYENDKYLFQSVIDSKYLSIPSDRGWLTTESQSATGLETTPLVSSYFIPKKIYSGMNTNVAGSNDQLFGMVYFEGARGVRTDNGADEPGVIIITSAGAFDMSGAPFCNGSFTSAIRMVEVEYTAPLPTYAVSAVSADATMGTAAVSATEEVEEGTEVTFTATANAGYKFTCWTVDTDTISTENPYTTEITAATALTANFVEMEFSEISLTLDKVDQEWQFVVAANDEDSKYIKVDWGNGELVGYEILNYWGTTSPWETTITGTPVGEGTVKIYVANLYKFDCSYNQNYGAKVTSVDISEANIESFICATNSITALDLSNNSTLKSLTVTSNPEFATLTLPTTNIITSLTLNDCALTAIDLSACTALTSVNVNNNTGLGSINVSANTALTTLRANNTGLTTLDISANTVLKNLYVNENQLTTLDVSKMLDGSYIFANDNKLTELVTASEMLSSSTRINILRNNFTLATLPAISGIRAYNYAPQTAMAIAAEIYEGQEIDLSSQNNIVGMADEAKVTNYTWYNTNGEEFLGYTEADGKFVFTVDKDTTLYCTMTTAAFPSFSGANVFTTTNIVIKDLNPAIVVTATPDVERQFTFEVAEATTLFIDWGNGELVETESIAVSDPDPSWIPWQSTTINGTPVGEGIVKIYGDGITYFDCSYSVSYGSKVTALDVTNATSLITLEACTNELTTLDLSNNSALQKLTAYSNPALATITMPTTNVITSLTLNDCGLTSLDLSSCTALTSVNVNNNTGLGSINVSANTALTTLRADNTGLTTIDVSANTALKNLYVNNNQLTKVDVSNMVAGFYLYANNNQLTSIVTGESNVTSKSRIQVTNNSFTLATLPAFTAITKEGTTGYNYVPQAKLTIAAEINEGEELDLSAQNNIVGRAAEAQATDYTWYLEDGTEFTNYTEVDGKFVFNVDADTELYCTMTTAAFPSFSGANAFTTTNIVVKNVAPTTYTVAVRIAPTSDWGTASIEGAEGTTAQIEENASVTVVATPAEGYEFEGWYDTTGANLLSADLSYTFTVTAEIEVVAWFQEPEVIEPSYCTDFATSTRSSGDRKLTSVTFSDGANGGTVEVNQSASYGAAIYYDATETEISLEAGKEITADVNWVGTWMHSYLYIDFNDDKEFTPVITNNAPAEDSELLSYSFWTGQDGAPSTTGASDERGYNSLGQLITGNDRAKFALPVFTIPTTVAEGTYRARFKIDWNTANPCAINATSEAPCVVDFMLTVTTPYGIADADADGVQVYATDGVIYINGYEGDVKVVNAAGQVVKDIYVNGAEQLNVNAGLYIVVTGDKTTKVVVK